MPHASRTLRTAPLAFDALRLEGALIAPAMLARIAEQKAGEQAESDYSIPKGLTLREEIARYFRIGQALFSDFRSDSTPGAAATIRFVEAFLRDAFGFADFSRVGTKAIGEHRYAMTLEVRGGRAPVVVVPPADELDAPSTYLPSEGRRRSAASALQDWLNAGDGALWGLCSNGRELRLARTNTSLTRPAFIQADLGAIFEGEAFADFAALWLLIHASRFGAPGAAPTDCALERWREAGDKEGVVARDRLREGVEAALLSLGAGFLRHPDSAELRERLASGALSLPDYFGQLLRLVYRLIFLLAAEDRDLLHPPTARAGARKLYAEGYSVGRLRDQAVRRAAWDRHRDQWEGLLIAFAALGRGELRLGLPALGGLFEPGTIPDLGGAHLANRDLMQAIYRLAWLREAFGLVPVNWRDMKTEELGSVYESLLELTPRLSADGQGFTFAEGGEAKGHARKTSGSYYTPDSLVRTLLDSALDPVLDRVERHAEDPAAALLYVTVIDPACGSGHFLLAAAQRIATRLARHRASGLASAQDYRHALREVVRACIHGVDRNPLAVELTKVALWIETVEPGKPLGFLDTNIRCGDSLLGVFDLNALRRGIPDAAYRPLTGDDKETAKYFETRNKDERKGQGNFDFAQGGGRLPAAGPLATMARALRAMPEDNPEQIAAKRRRFEAGRAAPGSWALQIAADLYTAAFLVPKTGGVPANRDSVTIPTTAHVWDALAGSTVYGPLVGRAQDLAGVARAFHWPLEFPDVMAAGGFDVVLGNPPWERIKLQEQEFFAAREPEIATAPNSAARGRLIANLAGAEPGTRERALYDEFETAKRTAEASSVFARVPQEDAGRFPLTGRGDVNTYALFAELFAGLAGPRGRAGVIVPTGIATDATTAPFFGALVQRKRLAAVYSFENEEMIFPGIHHAMKFCLLVLKPEKDAAPANFIFYARRVDAVSDPERRFTLSAEDIARINPNTKTAPIFRSRADAELTAKIYSRVPVLIDETKGAAGNPWGVSFMAMFHMANDSGLFRTAAQLREAGFVRDGGDWIPPRGVQPRQDALDIAGGDRRKLPLGGSPGARGHDRYGPLYEAKMIYFFDHRAASYSERGDERGFRVLPDTSDKDHYNSSFEVEPFYWVPDREISGALESRGNPQWLLGFKNVTAPTNERTMICAAIPRVGVGHSMPLIFVGQNSRSLAAPFIANLSSLLFDFIARQKVGGINFTFFFLKQLPVLSPSAYTSADLAFIVPRVLELSYTSQSMAPFARDLGYNGPPFAWDKDRRAQLRAELDAWYARAYGLSRDELRYILDPTDVRGPDYPSETFRVLKKNEIARYGEYRTARLVVAAWDAQEARPAAAQ